MPTYEYQCIKCGEKFDLFQSIKAAPLRRTRCAACGTVRPVRRLISAGGAVLFKGPGFYQTDYRSESYKKSAKSETSPATTPTTTGGNKDTGVTTTSPSVSSTTETAEPKPRGKVAAPKTTAAV